MVVYELGDICSFLKNKMFLSFFFFSSRRRHTRYIGDWSSDVCSSDLFATLIGWIVPLLLALTWATEYGWGAPRVVSLLVASTAMLGLLVYAESRAAEPIIPLTFFTQPVIAVCSVAAFVLGIGMFGTIIYLPLFMQGVLDVSATQSGNLLTPLLIGVVLASIIGGQAISRTGEYKMLGVVGSVLVAVGMILFARMDAATTRLYVAAAMVIAGFGMGLVQPVFTLAV